MSNNNNNNKWSHQPAPHGSSGCPSFPQRLHNRRDDVASRHRVIVVGPAPGAEAETARIVADCIAAAQRTASRPHSQSVEEREVCNQWRAKGACSFGATCMFYHDELPVRRDPRATHGMMQQRHGGRDDAVVRASGGGGGGGGGVARESLVTQALRVDAAVESAFMANAGAPFRGGGGSGGSALRRSDGHCYNQHLGNASRAMQRVALAEFRDNAPRVDAGGASAPWLGGCAASPASAVLQRTGDLRTM